MPVESLYDNYLWHNLFRDTYFKSVPSFSIVFTSSSFANPPPPPPNSHPNYNVRLHTWSGINVRVWGKGEYGKLFIFFVTFELKKGLVPYILKRGSSISQNFFKTTIILSETWKSHEIIWHTNNNFITHFLCFYISQYSDS